MASIKLDIVTAEKKVFSGEVDEVVAWGIEGQMGVLPSHAPLMTMLQPGELLIKRGGEEEYLVISGGFLEVRPDRIVVLADACERSDEINVERAEAAKRRAEEILKTRPSGVDIAATEAALRRSLARLKVAEKKHHRRAEV